MRATFLILSLLFSTLSYAQVIDYGSWRVTKHQQKEQKFWPEEIAILDEKNQPYDLSTIEDRPILVVFWATWCTYCVNKIPSLDILKKDFKQLPIEIIAVAVDYQGLSIIKEFYQQHNIKHLAIFYDANFRLFKALNVTGLPSAFLIDQNKRILLSFEGAVSWDDPEVRKMLLNYIPGDFDEPKNTYNHSNIINKMVPN
jgi:thiol-disulfide isomerase/thioredoxin